jgi:transcriptional regulator with XRE-family HTH domain
MNLNYVYRQLRKRAELKHFEIKPIGSAIRLKRKELGMTLEEGAEGICSISYLSKLENNQIDPNLDFVDQLVDRFGLKDQIAFDIESYESDLSIHIVIVKIIKLW